MCAHLAKNATAYAPGPACVPTTLPIMVEGSSVRIVDYAVVASDKVSPSVPKYTILGMLMGAFVSCLIIAIIEITDNQIRSEDYLLENYPEIPLLSVVPDMLSEKHHDSYYYYDQSSQGGKKEKTPRENKKAAEEKPAQPQRHPRSSGHKKSNKGGTL